MDPTAVMLRGEEEQLRKNGSDSVSKSFETFLRAKKKKKDECAWMDRSDSEAGWGGTDLDEWGTRFDSDGAAAPSLLLLSCDALIDFFPPLISLLYIQLVRPLSVGHVSASTAVCDQQQTRLKVCCLEFFHLHSQCPE